MKCHVFAGIFGAVALASYSSAAVFVSIDQYADPARAKIATYDLNTPVTDLESPGTGVVYGGYRKITLTNTANPDPGNDLGSRVGVGKRGTLDFSSDTMVQADLKVEYAGGDPANGSNLNWAASGVDGISFDVRFNDQQFPFTVQFVSGDTRISSLQSFTMPVVPSGSPATVVQIPFSAFSNLDTSDIDKITLDFTPPMAGDFTLAPDPTPEPASLSLLGLGALGLLRRRR